MSTNITGLTNGTGYTGRVYATTDINSGELSYEPTTTPAQPDEGPFNVSFSNVPSVPSNPTALRSCTSCTPDAACSPSDVPVSQNVAVGVDGRCSGYRRRDDYPPGGLNYTATGPVTVDCASQDDTATAGEDYISRSGMLRFATGERFTIVSVPTLNDRDDDNRETFKLRLSNVTGAFIASDTATGTIRD